MFDFAGSEILLIGVVALVLIGPKDLPVAMKAIAKVVKKARGMAAEFQTHVDDMMREADLHEVRDGINQLRGFNVRSQVEKAVDPDGSLRRTFTENPLAPQPVQPRPEHVITPPTVVPPETEAPAFIPPGAAVAPPNAEVKPPMPAFLPPGENSVPADRR